MDKLALCDDPIYTSPRRADHPEIVEAGQGCVKFIILPVAFLLAMDILLMAFKLLMER